MKNYDFNKLLYHKQKVGGLSVTSEKISLLFFAQPEGQPFSEGDFFGKELKILLQKEIVLPEGVVEKGVLKNQKLFDEALKKLVSGEQLPSNFVVVSLPVNVAQPFVYEFLADLKSDDLTGAVSLQALSSLPLSEKEAYLDWEDTTRNKLDRKRILLAMGVKKDLDPYLESFKRAGLAAVVCETHAWSLPREISFNNEPVLAVIFESDQAIFLVYQNNTLAFQFDVPKDIIFGKEVVSGVSEKEPASGKRKKREETANSAERIAGAIASYAGKIMKYIEADSKYGFELGNILLLKNPDEGKEIYSLIKDKIRNINPSASVTTVEDLADRLFVRGAGKRALLDRSKDVFSSLMSVGTEETYERQRLVSFADFFQKLAVSLMGFFIILLTSVLLIVSVMSKSADNKLSKQYVNIPGELALAKTAAETFNRQTEILSQIVKASPKWRNIFTELDKLMESGLIIRNIEASSLQPIAITGTAKNRENLIAFKNKLESSAVFAAPPIPLSALVGKENIDFSLKLELKDKSMLYE